MKCTCVKIDSVGRPLNHGSIMCHVKHSILELLFDSDMNNFCVALTRQTEWTTINMAMKKMAMCYLQENNKLSSSLLEHPLHLTASVMRESGLS